VTFSIAGICRRTGESGCALTTSSMAAGGRCPFVAPDVGVVLTQARTDPTLGALGLLRLAAGRSAAETIADLVASSPNSAWRQLAVIDRNGGIAEFTGAAAMAPKGGRIGRDGVAIGNAVANDRVIDAILKGFEANPERPLADRLIMALEYGLAAGGEAYPLRSAALEVARPGLPFVPIDLRVDFSETPIEDLRRMWMLWAPMVDGYVQRALDPGNAPPAQEIESGVGEAE
jgi:uncharacterized Ntn-hydrolase superfamily protein